MEKLLMEKATVKAVVQPVDLNTGSNAGARVDMSKCGRVAFVCVADAGTTPSSHTFSFQQHDAASSGNSKALTVSLPYYHKVSTATEFTKVEPTAASSFDVDTLLGDTKYIIVFEVLAEELDRENGYGWVSITQTDSGGAQIGTILAICHEMKNQPAYGVAV